MHELLTKLDRREAIRSIAGFCGAVTILPGRIANGEDKPNDVLTTFDLRSDSNTERAPLSVQGRVIVRAQDGGVLLEDRTGRLHSVTPDRIALETVGDVPFARLSGPELAEVLISESRAAGVDAEFQTHITDSYAIVTSAPMAYAQWAGRLLERMQIAFRAYWKNRGFTVHDLESPLPVLLLKNQSEFAKLASFDKTPGSAQGQGYYLVTANRIVLYDLTSASSSAPASSIAEIQRRIQRAPAGVATVVHEAIHQAAFNRGMHTRYADNPLWLTEGMAMYFETPDLKSRRGWSTIGRINSGRLSQFRDFETRRRKVDSLQTLLSDNSRFASPDTAADAYAEAWALTHFLIRTRLRDFVAYLQRIAAKKPLVWDSPDQRIGDFQAAFGDSLPDVDRQLLAFLRRLK